MIQNKGMSHSMEQLYSLSHHLQRLSLWHTSSDTRLHTHPCGADRMLSRMEQFTLQAGNLNHTAPVGAHLHSITAFKSRLDFETPMGLRKEGEFHRTQWSWTNQVISWLPALVSFLPVGQEVRRFCRSCISWSYTWAQSLIKDYSVYWNSFDCWIIAVQM